MVLAAAVVLGGCGVGGEGSAHVIDPSSVPRGLLTVTPDTTSPGFGSQEANVTLYFEDGDDLAAVNRAVTSPVTLRQVLKVLSRGPTAPERIEGLQSPLSAAGPLIVRSIEADTATVDIRGDFTALGGQDQIIAAAQLVFTVTAYPGVRAVRLQLSGQQAAVPTGNGSLTDGPLHRSDYQILGPR